MQYNNSLSVIYAAHLATQVDQRVMSEYVRLTERLFKQRGPAKAIEMLDASPLLQGRLELVTDNVNNDKVHIGFTKDCRDLGGAYIAVREENGEVTLCSYVASPREVQNKYSTILGGKLVEKSSFTGQTYPISFHAEGSKTFIQLNTDRCDAQYWRHQVARLQAILDCACLAASSRKHVTNLLELCSTALP